MFFGVEVKEIQEVIRYQRMTAVPLAPPEVVGLINLRGQIVTAIDLRRRLGVEDRGPDQRPMNVVVRTDDGAVSLLVDEIGDVLEVDASTYEHAPDTLSDTHRAMIKGVHKLDGRLMLILDTDKAVGVC
jgi:purine-binding chemotaxis protein CheW